MRHVIPAHLSLALAGLLIAASLSGCATTPVARARTASQLEQIYTVAHVAEIAYAAMPSANKAVVIKASQLDAIAASSIAAYAASPSDNTRAQAAEIAMAAMLTYTAQGSGQVSGSAAAH